MSEEGYTVTIDEVDYEWDTLPDDVKHAVNMISVARQKVEDTKLKVQQNEMMERGYIMELKEAMARFNSEQ